VNPQKSDQNHFLTTHLFQLGNPLTAKLSTAFELGYYSLQPDSCELQKLNSDSVGV